MNKYKRKKSFDWWDYYMFDGNKSIALKRDNYKCTLCGMTQKKHKNKFGRGLSVHHKDGRGKNSVKKNNCLNNLQTLCLSCHQKIELIKHRKIKLTLEQVIQIKKLKKQGLSNIDIVNRLSIKYSSVHNVFYNHSWKWVVI